MEYKTLERRLEVGYVKGSDAEKRCNRATSGSKMKLKKRKKKDKVLVSEYRMEREETVTV